MLPQQPVCAGLRSDLQTVDNTVIIHFSVGDFVSRFGLWISSQFGRPHLMKTALPHQHRPRLWALILVNSLNLDEPNLCIFFSTSLSFSYWQNQIRAEKVRSNCRNCCLQETNFAGTFAVV